MVVLIVVAAAVAINLLALPKLPDKMASHWNGRGQVDGWMDKAVCVWIMPGIMIGLTGMFLGILLIDPLRKNIGKFFSYYAGFIIIFNLFLLALHGWMVLWNLNIQIPSNVFMPIAMGCLFFYLGIVISNIKPNWFIGIRTPWTMSNEIVWQKTHKFGGILFRIAATIILIGAVFPKHALIFILAPILSACLILIVYSLWLSMGGNVDVKERFTKNLLKVIGFLLLGFVCLIVCYLVFVYMHGGFQQKGSLFYETTFSENASGGTLLFVRPDSRKPLFVSIETEPNESPSSVVDHLADAIIHSDVFLDIADYMTEEELDREKKRYVSGNTLRLVNGIRYYFAGTETGLGIPKPVTSVSCSFDSVEDHIKVFWENPSPQEYDQIRLYFRWTNIERGRPVLHVRQDQVEGTVSTFSLRRVLFSDLPPINIDDLDVLIVGYKNKIPSNAAGVHFCNSTNAQQELVSDLEEN